MDELNRKIARVAEELRSVQEELERAGLVVTPEMARVRRWELARHLGSLYQHLQEFIFLHHGTPSMAPDRREPRRAVAQAPHPDY
ncbi:MAG: hypothetical protein LAN37_00830 [Acidobacteriia bacterium]|jgi:hypothetical protein|nr:hypothetical protein [Terriglobia bacterium]